MVKRFYFKRLVLLMAAAGVTTFASNAMAAAFALWEQDAASIGNFHAGATSEADDASTAWYNPAGLVRIKNQQLIAGADPVLTNFRYSGSVQTSTIVDPDTGLTAAPQNVIAQGGGFNMVPFGHYAAPISDCVVFGMSIVVPFGLKTDYGNTTLARYAATLTSLKVVDFTPSLGIALNDKLSVGAGLDVQHLSAELDQYTTEGVAGGVLLDTISQNSLSDNAYGYRLGALYQFTPATRVGLSFRSKVTHHATGNSYFIGPLAENGVEQYTGALKVTATLPAITTLSIFQSINPCWDAMASATYTQWSVIKDLVLQNIAGVDGAGVNSNTVIFDLAEHFRNTWNYSIGANYHPCDKWIFRTGLGYDQSPTRDLYRNLQLPDSDRIAAAIGAHFQATKCVGFDVGWTHIFAINTHINNLSQTVGPETVITNGSVRANADVYGFQIKWDIT